jgi:hypothetical protein
MTNNSNKNHAAPSGFTRWVPGLKVLREYQAAWLPRDVMAGLVLTTMLVPVGIAYATASGVPGIYGLYATIVPCSPMPCSVEASSCRADSSQRRPSRWCRPLAAGDPLSAVALAARWPSSRSRVHRVGLLRVGFVTDCSRNRSATAT